MEANPIYYFPQTAASARVLRFVAAALFSLGCVFAACSAFPADSPSLTESQVKALFLMNFTKYVDWPVDAFGDTNSPITIGIVGDGKISSELKTAVEGKTVGGRAIVIQLVAGADDAANPQVLFISGSEEKRLPEILARIKGQPILTVGESAQFKQQGGIINFARKDGKIRLEIALGTARQSRLQISSLLLRVADVVRDKS